MVTDTNLVFTTSESDENQRIDIFLATKLPFSRSQIQKLISNNKILVNNNKIKASYKIKTNQLIEVTYNKKDFCQEYKAEPEEIPIKIMFEDDYLIIVNKDPGMVVHQSRGHKTGTLVSALLHHTAIKGGDINRPGIVHRLDKDTSGLLVVTKDILVHEKLTAMFKTHEIQRQYIAIVKGLLDPPKGRIETLYNRHPKSRLKFSSKVKKGKIAITNYETIEKYLKADVSFIKLRLETGRTHQIRVHMSENGHPVLGDILYGGRKVNNKIQKEILGCISRQALHAQSLGFIHPITNEMIQFSSDIPSDMKVILDKLKLIG